ncbi:MAG: hypothetical protein M4D80_01595 [Myxococcota bacterium]|nr:hypothetical protein [Myxococcota bacterium]
MWRDLDQDGVRDGEARYRYDHRGNVTWVWLDRNGNGIPEHEARYTYDARGLLTEAWSDHFYDEEGPLRRRYKYSAAGWLTSAEEAFGDAAPHSKATYRYDAAGRIRTSSTADPKSAMHYEYDAAGNRIREWNATWQKHYRYDAQQRVIRVWTDANPGPIQHEERRTYDAAGRLAQIATSSAGGALTSWNMEYDAADRLTRSWSDADGDGRPESETRTTYDAAGRILAVHEDRDGNGAPDVSHGTDYTADGRPARRWRDTDGDGRPNQETTSSYDKDGYLIAEVTFENRRPSAELRWEYKDGKPVRWWNPLRPTVGARYTYDASGNLVAQIGAEGATHYEYDVAAQTALRDTAPAQCLAASAPHDHPAQRAIALDPQRAGAGWLEVHKAAPGPIVVPRAPALPTLDADGYLSPDPSAGSALAGEYKRFISSLREKAFADRGWSHVAVHAVPAGTRSRYIRGIRVAKSERRCGDPTPYMVDRRGTVFVPTVVLDCKRRVAVKIHGSIGVSGCGREPPPVDLYAEVPDNARFETTPRSVSIGVPVCMEFRPDEGFEKPG